MVYAILKLGFRQRKCEETVTVMEVLSQSYKNMAIFSYFLIKLIGIDQTVSLSWWLIIEGFCIFVMYRRARSIYRSFRLMDFALVYEYQFKIADIILNLIIIAHFIVIFT